MWSVVKVVTNTGAPDIIGCAVGPFFTERAAEIYAERAARSALGYEKWIVKELQPPLPI